MHRPLTISLLMLSLLLTASCGDDDRANSPRSAAEAFVGALRDQEWAAACDVSVHDGRDACIKLLGRRGFDGLLRWARSLDGERVWALEDCRHVSGSLERFLIGRGERVLRIPTHLTAKARRSARQRGKSDAIDALGVARAALQEGLEAFAAAQLDRTRA